MNITEELFKLQDKDYSVFQKRLIPNIEPETIIGVRVPQLRVFAKKIMGSIEAREFVDSQPHKFYDENMLHGILLSGIKDYERCVFEVDRFLPFVDNWAVCDSMSPKVLAKNPEALMSKIREWTASPRTYECRFGLRMLMDNFLDKNFRAEYLEIPAAVKSDEYYVNMMIAWFYATALAKRWDETVVYLERGVLDRWIHNKTIQKACESYRINEGQKAYLKRLKR